MVYCVSLSLQILALEEMPITGLTTVVQKLYTALLMCHVRMIVDMRKGSENIVYMPEANTYFHSNWTLWKQLQATSWEMYKVTLFAHNYLEPTPTLGRMMTSSKGTMVVQMSEYITTDIIGRAVAVISFGDFIRNMFIERHHQIRKHIMGDQPQTAHYDTAAGVGAPQIISDFDNMTPSECAKWVCEYSTGVDPRTIEEYSTSVVDKGLEMLHKLESELSQVTLKQTGKTIRVSTGGKKAIGGMVTRDDVFSAFLLGTTLLNPREISKWIITPNPKSS